MLVKFDMPGEKGGTASIRDGGENCKTNYQFRAGQNLDEIIQQLKG